MSREKTEPGGAEDPTGGSGAGEVEREAARILVVDDDTEFRRMLEMVLQDEGYATTGCATGQQALDLLDREAIDAVMLDLSLPGGLDGIGILERMSARMPEVPVIMVSGKGSIRTAVDATQKGAFDFLEKPVEPERMTLTLRNALDRSRLQREIRRLRSSLPEAGLLTRSPGMRELYDRALRVAGSDVRVLILGESGTGKTFLARLIHRHSPRRGGPFVSINCSNLSPDLAESTLFGHEKGSFTGAVQRRRGRFELARGGTLFLDEVATLPPAVQAKLLRVLQDGEFERVGGAETLGVDSRVIAATNSEPLEEIEAGRLREDLYYRLKGVVLHLPPLRQRNEDVPWLWEQFVTEAAERLGRDVPRLTDEALAFLMSHSWPGNIRELENAAEAALVLSGGDTLDLEEARIALEAVGVGIPSGGPESESLRELTQQFQRELIRRRLREFDGHVTRTAESFGITRVTLFRTMKALGIDRIEPRPGLD